jgi:DNA-binding IclR family transcriptional regulator
MAANSSARSASIERGVAILELLDASVHGCTLSQISQRLHIPRSTAHVLIVTLQRLGYVQQMTNGHLFSLGVKAQILGIGPAGCLQLGDKARPHLAPLTETIGLASYVAVLDRHQALYIECCTGAGTQVDIYPGKRANLHCTAAGKIMLAGLRKFALEEFLSNHTLMRHTSKTLKSAEELCAKLECVRKEHYALDDEEQALGVRCLAVPLFDPLHGVVGALGITGAIGRIREENIAFLVKRMKKAAEEIVPGRGPWTLGQRSCGRSADDSVLT